MIDPPVAVAGQRVLEGPDKSGSQLRWIVALPDGQRAVLEQLLPELADDESVRRRYVLEAERLAELDALALAPTIAIGPQPEPRDPGAAPPWRLRVSPAGETLASWLTRRAPAPVEEVLALMATLAEAVHGVHTAGAVLRDLDPHGVVLAADGAVHLTDIGLARVDILSTRTASSLMLETSPYAAPEHLRSTLVDPRADVHTLGAMTWHALVGEPPFAGGLIRVDGALPDLRELAAVSDDVAELIGSCLASSPDERPESAREVAQVLRGRPLANRSSALARVVCQACGEPMRPGLRLCLSCGKQAVSFVHVADEVSERERYEVVLKSAKDNVEFLAKLRGLFETLGEGPPPELNFLTGDVRMYSKEERKQLQPLPATLFTDLDKPTADALMLRFREQGLRVAVEHADRKGRRRRARRNWLIGGLVTTAGGVAAAAGGAAIAGGVLLSVGILTSVISGIGLAMGKGPERRVPMAALRSAPAALPASDPLVARVATLLGDESLADDVRERVSELALLVQRLVDHRAANLGDADLAMVTEPVEPLIDLVEVEVTALREIDSALVDVDEGTIVRALAASEARGEPRSKRQELFTGLDRLRSLEDRRSAHMQRLLEATSLVRRSIELGLSQRDHDSEVSDRELRLALASLELEL